MKIQCSCGYVFDTDPDIPIEDDRCPNCDNNQYDISRENEYNSVCEMNQKNRRRVVLLEATLKSLANWHDGEPCWCDLSIGDPRMSDHSDNCKRIKKILEEGK